MSYLNIYLHDKPLLNALVRVMLIIILISSLITLTSCKGSKYDEAVNYYNNSSFGEAYDIFSTLGSYSNSEVLARNSKMMLDIETALILYETKECERILTLLLPYLDDGVDNSYARGNIREAEDTLRKIIKKCEMAIAGNEIESFTLSANELSGIIQLSMPIENPRLEISFAVNNDIYQGSSILCQMSEREIEESRWMHLRYFDLSLYAIPEGYMFTNIDLSKFSFLVPEGAYFFETGIFTHESQTAMIIYASLGGLNAAIAVSGKEGYTPSNSLIAGPLYVSFKNHQSVFSGGEMTIRLYSDEEIYLEEIFSIE